MDDEFLDVVGTEVPTQEVILDYWPTKTRRYMVWLDGDITIQKYDGDELIDEIMCTSFSEYDWMILGRINKIMEKYP